jgi:hypothetical protein
MADNDKGAEYTMTRPPMATPNAENPEVTDSLSFAGNITGPALGGGKEQVFAEFVANSNQLREWEKDEATYSTNLRAWLKTQVDERYTRIVKDRAAQAPPPPAAEPVSMADARELFGVKKGEPLKLRVEETMHDRGEDPDEIAQEEQGRTRRLFTKHKVGADKAHGEKGGQA